MAQFDILVRNDGSNLVLKSILTGSGVIPETARGTLHEAIDLPAQPAYGDTFDGVAHMPRPPDDYIVITDGGVDVGDAVSLDKSATRDLSVQFRDGADGSDKTDAVGGTVTLCPQGALLDLSPSTGALSGGAFAFMVGAEGKAGIVPVQAKLEIDGKTYSKLVRFEYA